MNSAGADDLTRQTIGEWCDWLRIVHEEVYSLVTAKHIFWSVQSLIRRNPKIQRASTFYRHFGVTYAAHAALGIRRLVDRHRETQSFVRLLQEIAERPQIVSRDYYRGHYIGSSREDLADRHFDHLCGENGAAHVPVQMIRDDLSTLQDASAPCKAYVDRRIAHRDRRGPTRIPTYNDLDQCIELLDRLYVKYQQFFSGNSMSTVMPTYQYDWQAIFDVPWRLSRRKAQE